MTENERRKLEEELAERQAQYHRCRSSVAAQRIMRDISELKRKLEQS